MVRQAVGRVDLRRERRQQSREPAGWTATGLNIQLAVAPPDCPTFALYVINVRLSGRTGTDLAQSIRQTQPDARILYFTANSEALLACQEALVPGAEALLEKPVSNHQLEEAASLLLFGHVNGPRD